MESAIAGFRRLESGILNIIRAADIYAVHVIHSVVSDTGDYLIPQHSLSLRVLSSGNSLRPIVFLTTLETNA